MHICIVLITFYFSHIPKRAHYVCFENLYLLTLAKYLLLCYTLCLMNLEAGLVTRAHCSFRARFAALGLPVGCSYNSRLEGITWLFFQIRQSLMTAAGPNECVFVDLEGNACVHYGKIEHSFSYLFSFTIAAF